MCLWENLTNIFPLSFFFRVPNFPTLNSPHFILTAFAPKSRIKMPSFFSRVYNLIYVVVNSTIYSSVLCEVRAYTWIIFSAYLLNNHITNEATLLDITLKLSTFPVKALLTKKSSYPNKLVILHYIIID